MEHMNKQVEAHSTKTESHAARNIGGVIFGIIEAILAFRLIFKLLGANAANLFVSGIYKVTQFFVDIFDNIFSRGVINGDETTGVFEPATVIAMVVIALIAWIVLLLLKPRTRIHSEKIETIVNDNQTK